MNLPTWSRSHEARNLIARVIAEQPDCYVRSHKLPSLYGDYPGTPELRFKGPAMRELRRYYERIHLEQIDKANQAPDFVTAREEAIEFLRVKPDELIEKLLDEQQLTETIGDPFLNRRAA